MPTITVNGIGLACADYLFTGLDFNSPQFKKYLTRTPGDGGISTGHLIYRDDLVKFAGKPLDEIRKEQGWLRDIDRFSIGGPCIVGLFNAAQLVKGGLAKNPENITFKLYAGRGEDDTAKRMLEIIHKMPIDISNYIVMPNMVSAATLVLSDQNFNDGVGERSFVYHGGALDHYTIDMVNPDFYDGDILFFSGTASVPQLHAKLTTMLREGKRRGRLTVVGTVFDFYNEKRNPGKRWPLGESDESYKLIDILVVDWVEAQKLSGEEDISRAIPFFLSKGVKSLVITNGAEKGYAWSNGEVFAKQELMTFSVCKFVVEDLKKNPKLRGDTTGCGDNFAGGLLAYVAKELGDGKKLGQLSLADALAWANGSGSFCCYSVGGTYVEKYPGDKLSKVRMIHDKYVQQLQKEGKISGSSKL